MTRLLLAVAVLAFVASGCGADENDPNLAAAAAKTEGTGSSRFALAVKENDGNETIDTECKGEADYRSARLHLRCDYGPGGWEMIAIGTDVYVRGDVFGFGGVDTEKWIKSTDDESFTKTFTPQKLLSMLRNASQRTERIGEEEIRGVDTVRYGLEVDCELAELDCDGATTNVDVWIDGDGLVRRVEVDASSSSPGTLDFYDFGLRVDIEPPAADTIVDIDEWAKPRACGVGVGRPVTDTELLEALRGQRFRVELQEECRGTVAAVLIGDTGGSDSDGLISCTIQMSPTDGAPVTVERRSQGGAEALALQNVQCVLADVDDPDESAPRRLAKAFAELERQIRK